MKQSYYHSSIETFVKVDEQTIMTALTKRSTEFVSQWSMGITSWASSIEIYKKSFEEVLKVIPDAASWRILLEYEIPRLGKRIDAVVLAHELIFVIEYKYERSNYELADMRQAEDYSLDLSDFHLESRNKIIIPILLASKAAPFENISQIKVDGITSCQRANRNTLSKIVIDNYNTYHSNISEIIDGYEWENSEYHPTPTIVQAARALFAGQKVEAITKSHAGATNLKVTTKYLIEKINIAKAENKKMVCFVTGVPGAGKTLVGLNIIHEKEKFGGDDFNTAYFSGNGPLIKVLRESLARDNYNTKLRQHANQSSTIRPTKEESHHEVQTKIQNLHTFIKDGIRRDTPPTERIVVFDEAQRCWTAQHFYNKGKQNANRDTKNTPVVEKSEAELLFEFMNRHESWSVIIALVGGGQEINTGEAGIAEWGNALKKFPNWEIHISPQLLTGDSTTAGKTLFTEIPSHHAVYKNDDLHLKVSQRSFRASNLNEWVNAIIDNEPVKALNLAESIRQVYPLKITRDIDTAKFWLKSQILGTKRIGLVASSGALRLRPYGINVKESIDEANWFLNDEKDVRSSYYLEIVATEFAVQGLELDWMGVCWDADLRREDGHWGFKDFSGTKWNQVSKQDAQQFLLNTYRVLLTRAREGMVIFVPLGDVQDETRQPSFYDPIYKYLKSCGLEDI
ncbi:MAG: DUF2075 domain-containing protein [Sphingobacteriaceae bacterium]|nr:DUF2075 domain-containing protein [Sphingobacteriaceae bacterium]